jgi:hypothetical protein
MYIAASIHGKLHMNGPLVLSQGFGVLAKVRLNNQLADPTTLESDISPACSSIIYILRMELAAKYRLF